MDDPPQTGTYHGSKTRISLDDLVATGLVMLADAGPGRALYEVATEWHHHFVCRRCQRVIDVPCEAGSRPCLEATVRVP